MKIALIFFLVASVVMAKEVHLVKEKDPFRFIHMDCLTLEEIEQELSEFQEEPLDSPESLEKYQRYLENDFNLKKSQLKRTFSYLFRFEDSDYFYSVAKKAYPFQTIKKKRARYHHIHSLKDWWFINEQGMKWIENLELVKEEKSLFRVQFQSSLYDICFLGRPKKMVFLATIKKDLILRPKRLKGMIDLSLGAFAKDHKFEFLKP